MSEQSGHLSELIEIPVSSRDDGTFLDQENQVGRRSPDGESVPDQNLDQIIGRLMEMNVEENMRSRPSTPLISTAARPQKPKTDPIDLRSLDYVGMFDHNLMCAICHCPFVTPVKLECDHYFCRTCLDQAMKHQIRESRCCPTCRRKITKPSVPVARIINRILDELVVKCPLSGEGCTEQTTRGLVQIHVDQYCTYSEVECPTKDCSLAVQRKDADQIQCLHAFVRCEDCLESFMEKDLETHRIKHCTRRETLCTDCKSAVLRINLEKHVQHCPQANFPCAAACYGCDFRSKRTELDRHLATCPLAKLVPFLKVQSDRLEAHEAALKHLRRKTSILETSFLSIQETLGPSNSLVDTPAAPSGGPDAAPFDSTAHHLLCLHESLREEVGRVSAAISELDGKANMMVINESLRAKEELAHTNAIIGGMRMQLHWLMNARLQNQQRVAMERTHGLSENLGAASTSAAGSATPGQPLRRLSDLVRQETKL